MNSRKEYERRSSREEYERNIILLASIGGGAISRVVADEAGASSQDEELKIVRQQECNIENAELFYPVKGETLTEKYYREKTAKSVCADCGLRDECLKLALENGEQYGIWGGMTPSERKKATSRRRNAVK